jgi:hypothetical protein
MRVADGSTPQKVAAALCAADEALQVAQHEVGFIEARFGREAAEPFLTVLNTAQSQLLLAFQDERRLIKTNATAAQWKELLADAHRISLSLSTIWRKGQHLEVFARDLPKKVTELGQELDLIKERHEQLARALSRSEDTATPWELDQLEVSLAAAERWITAAQKKNERTLRAASSRKREHAAGLLLHSNEDVAQAKAELQRAEGIVRDASQREIRAATSAPKPTPALVRIPEPPSPKRKSWQPPVQEKRPTPPTPATYSVPKPIPGTVGRNKDKPNGCAGGCLVSFLLVILFISFSWVTEAQNKPQPADPKVAAEAQRSLEEITRIEPLQKAMDLRTGIWPPFISDTQRTMFGAPVQFDNDFVWQITGKPTISGTSTEVTVVSNVRVTRVDEKCTYCNIFGGGLVFLMPGNQTLREYADSISRASVECEMPIELIPGNEWMKRISPDLWPHLERTAWVELYAPQLLPVGGIMNCALTGTLKLDEVQNSYWVVTGSSYQGFGDYYLAAWPGQVGRSVMESQLGSAPNPVEEGSMLESEDGTGDHLDETAETVAQSVVLGKEWSWLEVKDPCPTGDCIWHHVCPQPDSCILIYAPPEEGFDPNHRCC